MTDTTDDLIAAARARAQTWLANEGAARKPTINDVAALCGVSKKTISRIINNSPKVKTSTRNRVDAVISTIGYRPDPQARGLAFRHSFLIGMIYDNPNSQYVVNMQEGLLEGLRGTGYELVVHPCERSNPNTLETVKAFVKRLNPACVILTPSISEDDSLAGALAQLGCHYIRIASVPLDSPERMIITNDRLGGAQAAKHLGELGHTNIGLLSGLAGFRSSLERRQGFEQGLKDAGLKLSPQNVFVGDYTYASGSACGEDLAQRANPPTAIFAANDQMATGVVHALLRRGYDVPGFMSVVGYDDFQMATNSLPQLTTVHAPIREIAKYAALKGLEPYQGTLGIDAQRETGEHEEHSTVATTRTELGIEAQPYLVVRASSGPPRTG